MSRPESHPSDHRSRLIGAPALPLLVETRFGVPSPGPATVRRERVSALLDAHAGRRVTILAAPTGFGKTTALAAWVGQRAGPTAWLTLEAVDDDPVRFTTYVVSAIRRVAPTVGADALAALQDPRVDIEARVIGSLINDLATLDERVVLVLDDYHQIRHRACHAIVRAIVAGLPGQLRLIISSRGDPVLPLGRLRATGDLGEIRVDDLRFTPAEVRMFLDGRLPDGLASPDIDALTAGTEGWPAAVNLAAMSMTGGADPGAFIRAFGTHRHLVDYLAGEVLDAQPPRIREFLLRTSVLDWLSGDLCDALTDGDDGRTRLAELQRANLFVSGVDGHDGWFRYHRLLREALRAELAIEHPRLAPRLLLAAARWHEAQGSYDEAIGYALEADDHEAAARILCRRYLTFTRHGHLNELREHLAALDPARLGTLRGPVAFVAALAAGLVGEPAGVVDAHLAELDGADFEPDVVDGIPDGATGERFIRAMYPYGDLARQRAAGAALVHAWPDHRYLGPGGRMALGYAAFVRGDLPAARAALTPFGLDADERLITVFALSVRAMVEAELGHVDLAIEIAEGVHRMVVERGLQDAVATAIAHAALGVAYLADQRVDEAIPLMEQALHLTRVTQPLQRTLCLVSLAGALARQGDRVGARTHLAEASELVDGCADAGALPGRIRALERRIGQEAGSTATAGEAGLPTAAELRVLRLLASELSQREIAGELYLSPDTVKTHVRRLYRKLGVASRSEAVARARTSRLL
jgi:LuxR family maltose regulon positive regulatory protein